jgi:hypothetical protein
VHEEEMEGPVNRILDVSQNPLLVLFIDPMRHGLLLLEPREGGHLDDIP